jgi:Flp pilus assembly pilin Flp
MFVLDLRMFARLWRDRAGVSVIEYAIVVAMITVIVVVGVAVAGGWAHGMWLRLLARLG